MKKELTEISGASFDLLELDFLLHCSRPPDFFHDGERFWVVLFEFGRNEWIEVVTVEVGFGGLSEVFLVVGCAVVTDSTTGEQFDPFKDAFLHGGIIGRDDCLLAKSENLIVIGMSQFVQDNSGVL